MVFQLYAYGVHENSLSVTSETAEGFRFHAEDYFAERVVMEADSVRVGDGATLVLDEYGQAGKDQFCK